MFKIHFNFFNALFLKLSKLFLRQKVMFYKATSDGALWYENGLSIHYFLVIWETRGVTDGF